MENITLNQDGNKLVITIDTDQELYQTEKSTIVATSRGNAHIMGGLVLGLNLYKPLPKVSKGKGKGK